MDYINMTNDQLRQRIKLLRELRELETQCTVVVGKIEDSEPKPWVPDNRQWFEHTPENTTLDKAAITDILYRKERETMTFCASLDDADFDKNCWNVNFNWTYDRSYGVHPDHYIVAYTYDT